MASLYAAEITRGKTKATKVIRVKTPSAKTAPRTISVLPDGIDMTDLTRSAVTARKRVSSVLEKGRRRKVRATGELARRRTDVDERDIAQTR
jgi:hypothetical protein